MDLAKPFFLCVFIAQCALGAAGLIVCIGLMPWIRDLNDDLRADIEHNLHFWFRTFSAVAIAFTLIAVIFFPVN